MNDNKSILTIAYDTPKKGDNLVDSCSVDPRDMLDFGQLFAEIALELGHKDNDNVTSVTHKMVQSGKLDNNIIFMALCEGFNSLFKKTTMALLQANNMGDHK